MFGYVNFKCIKSFEREDSAARLCKGCLLLLSDREAHVAAGPRTSHSVRTRRWVNTARTDAPITVWRGKLRRAKDRAVKAEKTAV